MTWSATSRTSCSRQPPLTLPAVVPFSAPARLGASWRDRQAPRLDLVGPRAVATELGPAGADDLERDLAHVLLEAAAAHVAGRRPVLGHGQLGAFVTVRRAPHPHYGGERRALPLTQDAGEEVQHISGLVPVL